LNKMVLGRILYVFMPVNLKREEIIETYEYHKSGQT